MKMNKWLQGRQSDRRYTKQVQVRVNTDTIIVLMGGERRLLQDGPHHLVVVLLDEIPFHQHFTSKDVIGLG
jgi:hypothetical protein